MLRKNFVQKKRDFSNCSSTQTQTDEFMLFLTVQEKLKAIMSQYHYIEKEYNDAMNKIQYLQYKNNLLETSLLETTYVFNNSMLGKNIKHLKEITDLQELIQDQTNQLLKIRQKAVSRLIEQPHRQTKQVQQITSRDINAGSEQSKQISISKINPASKSKSRVSNPKMSFIFEGQGKTHERESSQNQFLFDKLQYSKAKHCFDMTLHQKKLKQFDSQMNKFQSQTARTNRSEPKYNSFKKKKSTVSQKQNECVHKMMKLEAEFKLKNFMSQFQKQSSMSICKSKEITNIEQRTFIYPMQQTYGSQILDKQSQTSSYASIMKTSLR